MRRYFYELNYRYFDKNGEHSLMIGYFSNKTKVNQVISSLKDKPGFCDTVGRFGVQKFAVSFKSEILEKSNVVLYEASHEYLDSDGYDNFIIFGVYESYSEAEAVIAEKSQKIPYSHYPDGFVIAESKIDLCGWQEGFANW